MKTGGIDRKSLLELVGAGAVLLGLIFVGFELRQNTVALRGTAIQTAATLSREQMQWMAQDPEISRIALTGVVSPTELSSIDSFRFAYVVRTFWVGMQANHRQWILGILPDEEWAFYRRTICAQYSVPGVHSRWEAERHMFIPEFVDVVEQCDPPADDARLPVPLIYEQTVRPEE